MELYMFEILFEKQNNFNGIDMFEEWKREEYQKKL
jgi:hypothetical protein